MYHNRSQNLQHHLWIRESNLNPGRRHPVPNRFLFHEKNFYKSITPRLTVQNVDKPHGFLRKFTPDGQLLLAFSQNQKSIDIYQYRGIGSVGHLLGQTQSECITPADHSVLSYQIRQKLFGGLFQLKFNVPIITTPIILRHYLNHEFSIFLDDGHYVLLASSAGDAILPNNLTYYQYIDLSDDTELYDYTFYLIDLRKGCIADTLKLYHDFVVLSNNHGVSVYDRTLAILSIYRRCIHLIELNAKEGKLTRLFTIGTYGSDLDRDRILAHERRINYTFDAGHALPLPHLKQKILAFMYREVLDATTGREKQEKLKEFYKNFALVEHMVILKMQFIDSDHILCRCEKQLIPLPLETINNYFHNNHIYNYFKLYVFYNISEQKVLKIYPKDSIEVLKMLGDYCDEFYNVHSLQIPWNTPSPKKNDFFRAAFNIIPNLSSADSIEAAVRFNPNLPISSQSFSTSPYLDYSLFNYDHHFISALERPNLTSFGAPIPFYDRDTGHLHFRVFVESLSNSRPNEEFIRNSRALVSFIFHPYEPFFISIQKFISRYVVNFHMYNACTKIKK